LEEHDQKIRHSHVKAGFYFVAVTILENAANHLHTAHFYFNVKVRLLKFR